MHEYIWICIHSTRYEIHIVCCISKDIYSIVNHIVGYIQHTYSISKDMYSIVNHSVGYDLIDTLYTGVYIAHDMRYMGATYHQIFAA